MIIGTYLNVTQKQWEEIKEKYVKSDNYHIVSNSKRKTKRCEDCGAYCPCTPCEGYCCEEEGLVDCNGTCEDWHGT